MLKKVQEMFNTHRKWSRRRERILRSRVGFGPHVIALHYGLGRQKVWTQRSLDRVKKFGFEVWILDKVWNRG